MKFLCQRILSREVLAFAVLVGLVCSAEGAGELQEALSNLDRTGQYAVFNGASLTGAQYVIETHSPSIEMGLIKILDDERLQEKWTSAMHFIGLYSSVDPSAERLKKLIDVVERIENSPISNSEKMRLLNYGYVAISRFGFDLAGSFLRKRVDGSIWREGLPELDYGVGNEEYLVTAQNIAIRSLTAGGDERSFEYVRSLIDDPDYSSDPLLVDAIVIALNAFEQSNLERDLNIDYFEGIQAAKLEEPSNVLPQRVHDDEEPLVGGHVSPRLGEVADKANGERDFSYFVGIVIFILGYVVCFFVQRYRS